MTVAAMPVTSLASVGARRLKILFFSQERDVWRVARSVGYPAQLGLVEGLTARGADVFTLTNQCRTRVRDLCAGRVFDQVWVHVYPYRLDQSFWEWVSKAAPVRIGLVPESLTYSAEELARHPGLGRLGSYFAEVQPYLTHVVAVDEIDVSRIARETRMPAFWWPQTVPARWIEDMPPEPEMRKALFIGEPYGGRADWLGRDDLSDLLAAPGSPEAGTAYPAVFEALNVNVQRYLNRRWLPGAPLVAASYLAALTVVRRRTFGRWLRALQRGAAVLNLPHYVKSYSGRVVEAMAAGRPVVSWAIPDRPRNAALFTDGDEIVLYRPDRSDELRASLERVVHDRDLARKISVAARRRLRTFHTTERRTAGILDWIESGRLPEYA